LGAADNAVIIINNCHHC